MGSARDRADAEAMQILATRRKSYEATLAQQAAVESAPRVTGSRNGLTAGNAPTMTTRERAEFRQAQEPEVLTPPRNAGGSGAFTEANTPMTLRERGERVKTLAEIEATPVPERTALEQYYIDAHNEELAQQEKWAREKAQEQARINAENDARGQRNLAIINIKLALGSHNVTDGEFQTVITAGQRRYGTLPTADQAVAILLALRECGVRR